MKLTDNAVLLLTVLLNVLKDVAIVSIFGFLCYHFNNIWIILFAILFIGSYNVRFHYSEKDKKEEK